MQPWLEYQTLVQQWDEHVSEDPTTERYRARWKARINHRTWAQKREALLWMCHNTCERCGHRGDLQLHHLHYDTLWYESHQDLELLCRPCHYDADKERADKASHKHNMSDDERALAYMEIANRFSNQHDWPVTYRMAMDHIQSH